MVLSILEKRSAVSLQPYPANARTASIGKSLVSEKPNCTKYVHENVSEERRPILVADVSKVLEFNFKDYPGLNLPHLYIPSVQ